MPQRSGSETARQPVRSAPPPLPAPFARLDFNRSKVEFKLRLSRNGFYIVILQCSKNVHTKFQENRRLEVWYVPLLVQFVLETDNVSFMIWLASAKLTTQTSAQRAACSGPPWQFCFAGRKSSIILQRSIPENYSIFRMRGVHVNKSRTNHFLVSKAKQLLHYAIKEVFKIVQAS